MDIGPWSTHGPYRFSKADMVQPRGGSAEWAVDGTRASTGASQSDEFAASRHESALLDFAASVLQTLANANAASAKLALWLALWLVGALRIRPANASTPLTPSLRSKRHS